MKTRRAISLVTLLVLIKTVVSQDETSPCRDVFDSFMPCMGYIEGIFQQPSTQCCRGVSHLNDIVNFISPGRRNNNGVVERVCGCIEQMGRANHLPFQPTAINNLPLFCSLTLSFPISVYMDCHQFTNMKEQEGGNLN